MALPGLPGAAQDAGPCLSARQTQLVEQQSQAAAQRRQAVAPAQPLERPLPQPQGQRPEAAQRQRAPSQPQAAWQRLALSQPEAGWQRPALSLPEPAERRWEAQQAAQRLPRRFEAVPAPREQ